MATLGEQLHTARAAAEFTLEEAAERTHIPREHLVALEADELSRLPGVPFARGFIRIYADLLQTDAGPLLDAYMAQLGSAGYSIAPQPSTRPARSWATPIALTLAGLGIAAVVAVAVVNVRGSPAVESAVRLDDGSLAAGATVELVGVRTSDVMVILDGRTVYEGRLAAGARFSWQPESSLQIRAAEADAVTLRIDGQDRGVLGDGPIPLTLDWSVRPTAPTGVAEPRRPPA